MAVAFLVLVRLEGAPLVAAVLVAAVLSTSCATLKGAFRTCLRIAPDRMHWVQARTVLDVPFAVVVRTFCKFGRNARRVMPVILVPTPPRYFALPLVSMLFPRLRPLPQISQIRAISILLQKLCRNSSRKTRFNKRGCVAKRPRIGTSACAGLVYRPGSSKSLTPAWHRR